MHEQRAPVGAEALQRGRRFAGRLVEGHRQVEAIVREPVLGGLLGQRGEAGAGFLVATGDEIQLGQVVTGTRQADLLGLGRPALAERRRRRAVALGHLLQGGARPVHLSHRHLAAGDLHPHDVIGFAPAALLCRHLLEHGQRLGGPVEVFEEDHALQGLHLRLEAWDASRGAFLSMSSTAWLRSSRLASASGCTRAMATSPCAASRVASETKLLVGCRSESSCSASTPACARSIDTESALDALQRLAPEVEQVLALVAGAPVRLLDRVERFPVASELHVGHRGDVLDGHRLGMTPAHFLHARQHRRAVLGPLEEHGHLAPHPLPPVGVGGEQQVFGHRGRRVAALEFELRQLRSEEHLDADRRPPLAVDFNRGGVLHRGWRAAPRPGDSAFRPRDWQRCGA